MNSSSILSNISTLVSLTTADQSFLESVLIARPFKQGELIVKSGESARYMMYVNDGYIMTYYTDKDGTDYVIQFAAEGWWSGDIHCLSTETTPYATKGLCDGELLLIPRLAMNELFDNHPALERYFRLTFQNSFIKQQKRFIENYSATAEERYQIFTNKYPGLENYVPQKYIASYLGITPEFLSKIRSRVTKKRT
jgi:CRP-like cAMP-binding protein